jgi:hypothetical protein
MFRLLPVLLLPVLAALVLTGCAGAQKETAPTQAQAATAPPPDDDATCQARGFKPGSSDYVQCRRILDRQHEREDNAVNEQRDGTARALLGRPPRASQ